MPNPKPKRRWYQFSLKTLMIVTTFFVLGVAVLHRYVESHREPTRKQQAVAEKLEQIGVEITWEPTGPTWMRWVFGEEEFRDVVVVVFPEDQLVVADDFANLERLPKLRELKLRSDALDGSDLLRLQHSKHLEKLSVPINTTITDDCLSSLRQLKHLDLLDDLYITSLRLGLQDRRIAKLRKAMPNCVVSKGLAAPWDDLFSPKKKKP